MNLVDSSGWLEYFTDGPNAEYFSEALEETETLIVSTINIYEVFKVLLREKNETIALSSITTMQQATVIEVNSWISINAARNSFAYKLPMADSLIYTTARLFDAVLWTQDIDFKDLDGVKFFLK